MHSIHGPPCVGIQHRISDGLRQAGLPLRFHTSPQNVEQHRKLLDEMDFYERNVTIHSFLTPPCPIPCIPLFASRAGFQKGQRCRPAVAFQDHLIPQPISFRSIALLCLRLFC
eukprot:GGOE01045311.1.p1 GENE.GGOE01045311.1~~GGOE01045311.1.p1  ORF type:complete len:113 (+),score=2.03 GGOE01045311.1:78-416(+)